MQETYLHPLHLGPPVLALELLALGLVALGTCNVSGRHHGGDNSQHTIVMHTQKHQPLAQRTHSLYLHTCYTKGIWGWWLWAHAMCPAGIRTVAIRSTPLLCGSVWVGAPTDSLDTWDTTCQGTVAVSTCAVATILAIRAMGGTPCSMCNSRMGAACVCGTACPTHSF